MPVAMIVACDRNRGIGINNKLPWHLRGDLQHFKQATLNKAVLMGRKTLESIGRPLPHRRNIVLSRQQQAIAGCEVYASVDEALEALQDEEDIMILGGEAVFQAFLPRAGRLYITRVEASVAADTFFPDWQQENFVCVASRYHPADPHNDYSFYIETWERRQP